MMLVRSDSGGRRRFKARRKRQMLLRRLELGIMLAHGGFTVENLAEMLGSSTRTIYRDIQALSRLTDKPIPVSRRAFMRSRTAVSPS